jgi:hypothetical protein
MEEEITLRPVVMWTLRRTGGTSLMTLMTKASGLPCWEHEPFNIERTHGSVTKAWNSTNDLDVLRTSIEQIISQEKSIKHCVELVPFPVNDELFRATVRFGYQHLILLRKDEIARIQSLLLARVTDAWGPEKAKQIYSTLSPEKIDLRKINLDSAVNQTMRDWASMGQIFILHAIHKIQPNVVFFEDIFTGNYDDRVLRANTVFSALGYDLKSAKNEDVEKYIGNNSQNSESVYSQLEGLREIVERVRKRFGRFDS